MRDLTLRSLVDIAGDYDDLNDFLYAAGEKGIDPSYLRDIWTATHTTIKEIRMYTGMTQQAFGDSYCIPKRTIECWESQSESARRDCPIYLRLLLADAVGMVNLFTR